MTFPVFKLEEYFTHYEFSAPYLLCCSDAQTLSVSELVALADDECRDKWERLSLGYTEVSGSPSLRQDIAARYHGLRAENIVCFAGAEEGIFTVFSSLLRKGDHVIVITPCYQSLRDIPRTLGCDVTSIDLLEEEKWQVDVVKIKHHLRDNTRLVIINTPHNPTGQMMDQESLKTLINMLRTHGTYLFSDEVYFHLGPSDTQWSSQVAEMYERGISLNVMSKAYGLAGLRIGWIATQDKEILQKCVYFKHYTTICNAAPSEILAQIALRAHKTILQRNNHIIDKNLELFEAFLEKYKNLFSWIKPKGSCTGFVHYYGHESVDDFAKRLVQKNGVLLLPGSIYDAGDRYFRVGFGRKNFSDGLSRLENFLAEGGR